MRSKIWTCIIAIALASAIYFTSAIAAKETTYTLTNEMDRIKTVHDQGFSIPETLGKDDPHFGWGLGTFYIQGYTEVVKDEDGTPVFLKNVGDELILGFDLKRNIDKLGKNGKSIISEDSNGYDDFFEVDQTNFGRGCLIVLETDYRNASHRPVIYTDYLTAVQNKTANTKVKPFAEGDYIVALDYELKTPGLLGYPNFGDYTISFPFKIRNSNCMIFFYKLGENQDEITNGAVAEDGFKIDFKNSYFLTVNVTKDIIIDNDGILTLDTRFSRAAADGTKFTDEGLYTITVSNQYTGEQVSKRISVGHNKVLNVYAAHNGTMDINDIAKKLDQGAEVNNQWMLVLTDANAEDNYNSQGNDYNGFTRANSGENYGNDSNKNNVPLPNISIFAFVVIVLIVLLKIVENRKKNNVESKTANNNYDNIEVPRIEHGSTESTDSNPDVKEK